MKQLWLAATIFLGSYVDAQKPRVLHMSFHRGCINEFKAVAQEIGIEVESLFVQDMPQGWFDGITRGNGIYNIGHERARRVWELHKDFFNQFDAILTSDTVPLARIFLQNGWEKPLVIWVCNRFDYCDQGSLDCAFPDKEYYDLIRRAKSQKNVVIASYTPFEAHYAQAKGVDIGSFVIKPCAPFAESVLGNSAIPVDINKKETLFIPPYFNDTVWMKLSEHCTALGIPNYCGRYNGPNDLKEFKGIIHLPYAWSNLALFENMKSGIPYFVPSREFLEKLHCSGGYWHCDGHYLFNKKLYDISEWYAPEHKDLLIYFDSWEDLKHKIQVTDYVSIRERIKAFAVGHKKKMLKRWKKAFAAILEK